MNIQFHYSNANGIFRELFDAAVMIWNLIVVKRRLTINVKFVGKVIIEQFITVMTL